MLYAWIEADRDEDKVPAVGCRRLTYPSGESGNLFSGAGGVSAAKRCGCAEQWAQAGRARVCQQAYRCRRRGGRDYRWSHSFRADYNADLLRWDDRRQRLGVERKAEKGAGRGGRYGERVEPVPARPYCGATDDDQNVNTKDTRYLRSSSRCRVEKGT